jgi:hypothetical protein
MKALRARRSVSPEELSGPAREAYRHIVSREHTTKTLAAALGVSVATAARTIAALRAALERRGLRLVSVRSRRAFHFEILGLDEYLRKAWKRSRLRALAGAGGSYRKYPGRDEDEIIYGEE